ncbi:MAG: ATP-binding protein [bacterium]|nr:ATP-binding protein [bacterium]
MDKKLYPRITATPRTSFFLFGARGAGKSTWARDRYAQARRIDLLDEGLYQSLLADPSLFSGMIGTVPEGGWVMVDEIQRIPGLLNEVHRFIEERDLRFALLGSSARKLKTAGTNLLAGRALWKTMFPLVPEELGADFDLERVLRFGAVPLIWQAEDPRATLEAYVQLYLREEIKAEALVRNLPGFVRFLPIAGLFHGQGVNVSAIARDSGTARTTVTGYIEILEDTLLAWRLSAFEARLRVRERKHPKLYWIDPGLARAVKKQLGPLGIEERGALLEGWIHTLLRTYGQERELWEEIFYWSPLQARGVEVDFLLRRGNELLALEVKAASTFSRSQLSGLKAIGDLPEVVRRVLVYTGRHELKVSQDIEVWPVERFLDALANDRLWP